MYNVYVFTKKKLYLQKKSISRFLPWISLKATKRLTASTCDKLQSGDGFTTCHVCNIPHSLVILVKRGRLGGIFETPLLPLRGSSVSGI
jgi:hypothetical protein